MNPLLRWTRMPALLAGCYAILLTAVLLGSVALGGRTVPSLASAAELGLGSNRVGIEPLTDRFIDRALGPGAAESRPTTLEHVESRRRDAFGGVDEAIGEVVDHAFTNNDQANAYPVTRLPFTGRTSTDDASREAGEPECGPQLGGTVWYRYTATRNEGLLADTFGTGYQTSLAAYRKSASGPVALDNACDFDPQGNSQIKFDVSSGATYLLQVGAAVRGGALTFNLNRLGRTILASVSTGGSPGNAASIESSVSSDGRFVAFASRATNLVRGLRGSAYTNCRACYNVFLRDRKDGTTKLVSAGPDGRGGNATSNRPQVSDDGRFVSFDSIAWNLVAGDSNDVPDVFVRDMMTGRTERASLSDQGQELRPGYFGGGASFSSMSGDGRYVAFTSSSPSLVEGDEDEFNDVFVRDRLNGTTRLVSPNSGGGVGLESISRNGRWIILDTTVPMSEQDGDLSRDVFVRDLWTDATELVSVPEPGHELAGHWDAVGAYNVSQRAISDDGRFVVFGSDGALVDGDTNGVLDVFVRDRLLQATERVSVSSSGKQGTGGSTNYPSNLGGLDYWSISGNGRTVAFATDLNFLEPSDANSAYDAYVHDRTHGVTLRISQSGDVGGGFNPNISGDGMYTTFYGRYPLAHRDTNKFDDVFLFSPLFTQEQEDSVVGVASASSVPTARCAPSSEYARVGVAGAHEDVTPAPVPFHGQDDWAYQERSVVRFKYRIDVSQSSAVPSARTADVTIELGWDNDSDYDLYVYDANGELLAYGFNPNLDGGGPGETVLVSQVPHCSDLRVEIVNNVGLPTREMTLDTTLGSFE